MAYNTYPAVDDTTKAFPPSVRSAIRDAPELEEKFAHLNEDEQLVINGIVIETGGDTPPIVEAGLNTLGFVKGVFIVNEGTLPPDLPIYAVVIEQE